MKVTRQHLIDLCDKFLGDKIDKPFIRDFAWETITSDEFELIKDEIISDTIFEWDNEDMNFEINKTNIQLWKNRLLTEQDDLLLYNSWNAHIDNQKEICQAGDFQMPPHRHSRCCNSMRHFTFTNSI